MALTLLEKVGDNDIESIALWDAQDVATAGSKDPSAISSDTGSLNGNWIRFRNFVNGLRVLVDGKHPLMAALSMVGGVLTVGKKAAMGPTGNIEIANARTTGFATTTIVPSGVMSPANVEIDLPNVSGTMALLSDVTAVSDLITEKIGVVALDFSFKGVTTDGGDGEFAQVEGRQTLDTTGIPVPIGTVQKILFSLADGSVHMLVPAHAVSVASILNILQESSVVAGFSPGQYACYLYVAGLQTASYILLATPALYGTIYYKVT
jgi:hypothetical protein